MTRSTLHNSIPILLLLPRNPKHIIAANEHLPKGSLGFPVDPLDGAAELNVHVAVDADQAAGVLGVAPLEADAHVGVDERLQHWARVHGDELCGRGRSVVCCSLCRRGVGRLTLMFAICCWV